MFKRVMRWSVKLRRGGNVGLLVIVVVLTVIGRVRRANPVIVALRVDVLAHAPTVSTAVCVEFLLVVLRDSKQAYALGKCNNRVRGRGCGSSKGIARYFYHCGSSDDVLSCLKRVKFLFPQSPVSLIGFSLGGNIALKLAGDLALAGGEIIKQVIAVNPPSDLKSSVQTIGRPENSMYQRYFIRLLREDVHFRHKRFGLPLVNLPKNMSIFEFDEYYIAP
ncbi:MAG: hypothetical protein EBT28_00920, partial [Betaproteobacteria bacterium]|nr:hypothetical protein [Betaproteobacteria bacterium]